MAQRSAVILVIHRADAMSPKGKRDIAAWLRRQASMLVRDGHRYAKRFTGRYLYYSKAR